MKQVLVQVISVLLAGLASSAVLAQAVDYSKLSNEERQKIAAITEVWQQVPVVKADAGKAPSDAINLLDLSQWQAVGSKAPAGWELTDGVLTVKPGAGDIESKQAFCDVQLHMEWRTPTDIAGKTGQQRNNSGVFLQSRYEVQVLDSYNNPTYSNGQAGSVYKQTSPLVNASRAPGEWQSYDIIYNAPRFNGNKLTSPGFVTVLHNGVLVQNHTQILGNTEWIGAPSYTAHGCLPLKLQDHGNPISFRNLWVREL